MPLPILKPNQAKEDFIKECLSDKNVNKEWSNTSQRFAVCQSLYKQQLKKKQANGSNKEPKWEETAAEKFWIID